MQVKTPDLGVDSADVSEILVKVGDTVDKEQSLLVLESAKASVEVPSPASGVIKSIAIAQGQSIKQGDVLFELEDAVANTSEATSRAGSKPVPEPTDQQPDANKAQADATDFDDQDSKVVVSKDTAAESKLSEQTPASHAEKQSTEISPANSSSATQDVLVPDLGVDEADVSEILVNIGDTVEKEQSLLVLESAKASVEVPSPYAGVVKSVAVQAGQKIKQGMVILTIATGADKPAAKLAKAPESNSEPAKNPLAEQQTALSRAKSEANTDTAQNPQSDVTEQPAASASTPLSPEQVKANSAVYAGPAVRQLARQLGVELAQVKASGANARIIKEDVFAFVKTQLSAKPQNATGQAAATTALPPLPSFEKFGGSTLQPMSRLQQVSVPQLSLNNYIPQVTQFDLADITELENWRNTLKADYKKQDISLTILAFIVKALAYLLKKEPTFNSHLADDQKSIVLRNEIHMGIAVATIDGLTVPVLRNPDQLSIEEIAIQLGELSQKARDKKLKPQELQGASFTLTSLGSIGGTAFTPLVNWPQVAILGISPATMQAVWDGSEFRPRLMLPLSLSYDHRVINGADAARFSHALSDVLGDIRRILL